MDLLESYNTSSSSSDSEICELGRRDVRKVYLITYSQANTLKFPTRNSFAEAVLKAFHGGFAKVLHWCCSQESPKKSGIQYHMSLKLDRNQWWLRAKKFLTENCGISVHISSVHVNYYTAWKYVTKEDRLSVESEAHPDLNNSEGPSTTKAHEANRDRKTKRGREKQFVEQDIETLEHESDANPRRTRVKETREKVKAFECIRSFRNYFEQRSSRSDGTFSLFEPTKRGRKDRFGRVYC